MDDITALMMVRKREVAEVPTKVMKKKKKLTEKASNCQSPKMERKERAR